MPRDPLALSELIAPIWYRQKRESSRYYKYFKMYRGSYDASKDIEAIRSVRKIAEIEGINHHTLVDVQTDMLWIKRAQAYDNHIDMREKEEMEAQIKIMSRRWARRRMEKSEHLYQMAERVRSKVLGMADGGSLWTETSEERIVETYPDGRAKRTQIIIKVPAGWKQRDIAVMARHFDELAKSAFREAPGGRDEDAADLDNIDISAHDAEIMMRAIHEDRMRRRQLEAPADGD